MNLFYPTKNKLNPNNVFRVGSDVDVNYLYLQGTKATLSTRAMVAGFKLPTIIQHIKDRRYVLTGDNVSKERLDKIFKRGYSFLDAKSEPILTKAHIKCPSCQDKKIIDMGFYKRLCMDCCTGEENLPIG